MTFREGNSRKDYLYEFQTDDSTQDDGWNVFVSYGRILDTPKERKRTLKWKNITRADGIAKIRDDVIRKRARYQIIKPPSWWVPLPPPELEQIDVMLAKAVKTPGDLEKLENAYEDDNYIAELKLDGHRAKAHFVSPTKPSGLVRFDSRGTSTETGHFVENTGSLFFLSSLIHMGIKEFVHEWHGTVFDGEVTHPGGLYAVGSIMGALPDEAMSFQKSNGCATYTVFDVIRIKGKDVTGYPWTQRRKWLEDLHKRWTAAINDERRSAQLGLSAFRQGTVDKRAFREWAYSKGHEGLILKDKTSKYVPAGRSWQWIKDKKMTRVSCVITGFTDSTSASFGPKGWIKNIHLSQYKDGELIEVGTTSGMSEQIRQYISENKERCMGEVVDVQCQEQLSSHALRHPQFVSFRKDIKAEDCTVDQEG